MKVISVVEYHVRTGCTEEVIAAFDALGGIDFVITGDCGYEPHWDLHARNGILLNTQCRNSKAVNDILRC